MPHDVRPQSAPPPLAGGEFARDSDIWQYSNSKLCSVMVAREMARRLKASGCTPP